MVSVFKLLFRVFFGKPKRKTKSDWQRPKPSKPAARLRDHEANVYKKSALTDAEVRKNFDRLAQGQVIHIIDGDSVIIVIGNDENEIRLDSIDCPEGDQPWGDIAAFGLIKLIGGRRVLLEQHGQDPYRRTLATLYVNHGNEQGWINVNERMVMLGHAWVMRKYYDHLPHDRKQKLNSLERWAKSKNVGLWKEPNPVPPWRWRNSDEIYPE